MRAVVGIGSNVGARLATMRAAVARLGEQAPIEAVSRVYETDPVGPPQPRYLNAAALVSWPGTLRTLLDALLSIEQGLGRVRGVRWGPRTIDLDILYAEGATVDEPGLTVPHAHLRERAFAMGPLLDVLPNARDPGTGEAYAVGTREGLEVVDERLW